MERCSCHGGLCPVLVPPRVSHDAPHSPPPITPLLCSGLHDVLCVVGRVLESKSLVPGGGAVEAALSMYLESFATTLGTKEQLAIREFAEALLVIPKTLAVNAAQDATDLVAKLCAFHHASQTNVSMSAACLVEWRYSLIVSALAGRCALLSAVDCSLLLFLAF